jgi:hypothetical protein
MDPLYVHAHEILLSPSWAADRAKWSIAGDEKSLKWVTDDQTCSRIALAVAPHTTAASETHVSAVQLGNAYFASFGPWSQGILLDSRFKVLTVFVVPD